MQVPLYEAKNRPSALLAEVARGAEITNTNRGVSVAKLAPPGFDRDKARRAVQSLRDASRGTTLSGLALNDLIEEGRR